jgi:predicted O-methyltransferase YrrM
MDKDWIAQLLAVPELCQMGHGQSAESADLGLGWLYYALARLQRPRLAVCIGSWRGFVPLILGKALQDGGQGGRVLFIDPSLVDDFWRDPAQVQAWFARFGVHNIEHHALTTQDFMRSPRQATVGPVGLLFVDGMHTAEQARFDHEAFAPLLEAGAPVLFHDGVRRRVSRCYGPGRAYEHTVVEYMDELRLRPELELSTFEQSSGVVVLRSRLAAEGR